jgi:hypothetical protein
MRPFGKGRRLTLAYELPETISVAQTADVDIRLRFRAHMRPSGTPMMGFALVQEAEFEFLPRDGMLLYETLEPLAQHVRNFVLFAARQWIGVTYMHGYLTPEDDRAREEEIEILSRYFGTSNPDLPELDPHGLLFYRTHNGQPPVSRLDRWLELQGEDELGPVVNLYLSGLYQPEAFVEWRFLALAQACDSLHSRRFDATVLPKADHRANVQAVLEALSSNEPLREWARVRLEQANRKPFGDAMLKLLQALPPELQALIPDLERTAQKVKTTRNYMTHWNPSLRADAATSLGELDGLARALRCVLEALLLLELGFRADETDELLKRNVNYRRELMKGLEAAGLL